MPAERVGQPIILGIRAEHIEVVSSDANGAIRADVLVVEPLGSHNLVTLLAGGQTVKATTRPDAAIERGAEVGLRIDPRRVRWLDAETGVALDADPPDGPPTRA